MKPTIIISFILLSLFSHVTSHAECQDLDQWIQRHLKTTNKAFKSYHWGERVPSTFKEGTTVYKESDGTISGKLQHYINWNELFQYSHSELKTGDEEGTYPILTTDLAGLNYFQSMASNFSYDESQLKPNQFAENWNVGMGLNAAFDPLQSMDWAGENWILLEINTPAGTNYLDYSNLKYEQINNNNNNDCASLSIPFTLVNPAFNGGHPKNGHTLNILYQNSSSFRKIFQEKLKQHKISFIKYGWNEPRFTQCNTTNFALGLYHISFNYIDPEITKSPGFEVKLFTKFNFITTFVGPNRDFDFVQKIKKEHESYEEIMNKMDFMIELIENEYEYEKEKIYLRKRMSNFFSRKEEKGKIKYDKKMFDDQLLKYQNESFHCLP
ncbi:MAG: hypothetical protein QE271_12515 [Bacteriovoracaceae bacterium]|nr:hypothetical protein [Bacteriovoracaceae bacterium]